MGRLLPRLGHDRRGASAIEFALVAPMLALIMMAILDFGLGWSRKYQLEQASYRALELVTVGTLQSDYAYVEPEAMSAAGVPAENVDVTWWLECDNTQQDFSTPCTETQQIERFLQVTIRDSYEPIFPYGPLGSVPVPLTARSTIRIQ